MSYKIYVDRRYCVALPTISGDPVMVAINPVNALKVVIAYDQRQLKPLAASRELSSSAYCDLVDLAMESGLPKDSDSSAIVIPNGAAVTIHAAFEQTKKWSALAVRNPVRGEMTQLLLPKTLSSLDPATAEDGLMILNGDTTKVCILYSRTQGCGLVDYNQQLLGSESCRLWKRLIGKSMLPNTSPFSTISITGELAETLAVTLYALTTPEGVTKIKPVLAGH